MFELMPIIFVLGIFMIAFEEKIHVNKAATALAMSSLLWGALIIDAVSIFTQHPNPSMAGLPELVPNLSNLPFSEQCAAILDFATKHLLGDVSETLFFVLASMVIIEVIDINDGFRVVVNKITSINKRVLMWEFSVATFFISALMGNISAVIIVIAMLRKIVPNHTERLPFVCMAVIAAGAGGSWSPIGDVTALLLWVNGNLTAWHQSTTLILPALTMLLIPLIIITFRIPKDAKVLYKAQPAIEKNRVVSGTIVLIMGLVTFMAIPLTNQFWNIPPFMSILAGLALLWIYTDRVYARRGKKLDPNDIHSISSIFSRIDIATIMFFLGLLMSVQALKVGGQLTVMSDFLDNTIHAPMVIAFILGICSSFLDNVALVASTMGMYSIAPADSVDYLRYFIVDGEFWTFLVYCAVSGGSILIIGSAAGVTAMGMENIKFGYYMKKFTPLALIGYVAGAGVYLLI